MHNELSANAIESDIFCLVLTAQIVKENARGIFSKNY